MDEATRSAMFSSVSTEYGTPRWLFDPLNKYFQFTLDAAASHENALLPIYYTQDGLFSKYFSTPSRRNLDDGLTGAWSRVPNWGSPSGKSRVWVNPPYGRGIGLWVRKAVQEVQAGCELVVMLLPNRSDTDWWQRWVRPYAETAEIYGRVKFEGGENSAPFPSVLAIYEPGFPGKGRAYGLDLRSNPEFTRG